MISFLFSLISIPHYDRGRFSATAELSSGKVRRLNPIQLGSSDLFVSKVKHSKLYYKTFVHLLRSVPKIPCHLQFTLGVAFMQLCEIYYMLSNDAAMA